MDDGTAALAAFQPQVNHLTESFWEGAREGSLMLARCPECRAWQHPPLELCRLCATPLDREAADLVGRVYAVSVMRHSAIPLFAPPYTVAVVEIGGTGGPRVVLRVVGEDAVDTSIDDTVSIEMADLPGGSLKVPVARRSSC